LAGSKLECSSRKQTFLERPAASIKWLGGYLRANEGDRTRLFSTVGMVLQRENLGCELPLRPLFKETLSDIGSSRSCNCQCGVIVYVWHLSNLECLVLLVVLHNTKGIYPKVLNVHFASHVHITKQGTPKFITEAHYLLATISLKSRARITEFQGDVPEALKHGFVGSLSNMHGLCKAVRS